MKAIATRFYHSEKIDIEQLAHDFVGLCLTQDYQVHYTGNSQAVFIEIVHGNYRDAIVARRAAVNIRLQRIAGGVAGMVLPHPFDEERQVIRHQHAVVREEATLENLIGMFQGNSRQKKLNNILTLMDKIILEEYPGTQIEQIPPQLLLQLQQQIAWSPQPSPPEIRGAIGAAPLLCKSCNAPYLPGSRFCSSCGCAL